MRLPYGKSDFADLRRGGYAYADKTGFIAALESAEKGRQYLVFLRPRRMGKTLLISMLEHYHDMLVRRLVAGVLGGAAYSLDPARVEEDLRLYYNGYLFSRDATERMFNPDMVLYFLKELRPPSRYPSELLDINVRTDYGRIQRLLFTPEGEVRPDVVEDLLAVIVDGSTAARLQSSFPLDRAYESGYFVSLLYYMGLLTLQEQEGWLRLGIPNYAIRTLYWEAFARLLQDLHHPELPSTRVDVAIETMARRGDVAPFLTLIFTRVLRKLSNRDLIRLDEKTMKVLLLAYLSLSEVFFVWSE